MSKPKKATEYRFDDEEGTFIPNIVFNPNFEGDKPQEFDVTFDPRINKINSIKSVPRTPIINNPKPIISEKGFYTAPVEIKKPKKYINHNIEPI